MFPHSLTPYAARANTTCNPYVLMIESAQPGAKEGWAFLLIALSKNKSVPLHNGRVSVRAGVMNAGRSPLLRCCSGA